MSFIPLKEVLNTWLSSKKFRKVFQGQQVVKTANQYFKERKNWPPDMVKASFFSQGRLIIKCRQSVISSEIRLEESQLKKYLQKRLPGIKIDKIFYKIG